MPDIDDFDTREPVRPLHTETIHVEKRHTRWPLALGTLAVLGLLAIPFFPRATDDTRVATTTTTTTTTQLAARPITYNHTQWEARGNPESFAQGELVRVGTSEQGDALYANPEEGYLGGGGGGGRAMPHPIAQANGRVYLMTSDGRFQPLSVKQ